MEIKEGMIRKAAASSEPLAKLGSQLCCKGGLPTYGSLKTAVVPVVVYGTKARPVGLLRCTDSKIFFPPLLNS